MVLALPSSWKYLNIFQISYFVYQLNGDEYYRILVFLYFSFLPSVLISIESWVNLEKKDVTIKKHFTFETKTPLKTNLPSFECRLQQPQQPQQPSFRWISPSLTSRVWRICRGGRRWTILAMKWTAHNDCPRTILATIIPSASSFIPVFCSKALQTEKMVKHFLEKENSSYLYVMWTYRWSKSVFSLSLKVDEGNASIVVGEHGDVMKCQQSLFLGIICSRH